MGDGGKRAVFGDYVHIFDIEQAVRDGVTVPIDDESRLARLELKEADGTQLNVLARKCTRLTRGKVEPDGLGTGRG